MAHELAFDTQGAQMLFAGETPWHKLGVKIDKAVTAEEALAICRADYTVYTGGLFTSKSVPVRAQYIYRLDAEGNQQVLGDHVGPDYTPLQNRDAFAWFNPFIEAGEAVIDTAGVMRDGARVWVLARINRKSMEILPGDEVVKYVLLSNSHDGMMAARVGYSGVRVVCANTLAMAIEDKASKLMRVKHTRNIKEAIVSIRETMNLADAAFEATAEQYRRLVKYQVVEADIKKYVQRVVATPAQEKELEDELASGVGERVWEQIKPLLETGMGANIPGVRGTLWGAYNSVTEYLQHYRGKEAGNRLESTWFKDGAALNAKALKTALAMAS